jgi:hypothetical protein
MPRRSDDRRASKANGPHSLVQRTTYISIAVQFLTGLVLVYALVWIGRHRILTPRLRFLHTLLILEGSVQAVEFIFYLYIVSRRVIPLQQLASYRYMDWVLTTPVMLVTLAAYMSMSTSTFSEFWVENFESRLLPMVMYNEAMMLFGWLGEMGYVNLWIAAAGGFVAFVLAFRILYSFAGSHRALFWVVAIVWSVYGIAYLFPAPTKNAVYNLLDVVAKNFFGVFLSVAVLSSDVAIQG